VAAQIKIALTTEPPTKDQKTKGPKGRQLRLLAKRGKSHVYLSSFVLHGRAKNCCLALAKGRGLGQKIGG